MRKFSLIPGLLALSLVFPAAADEMLVTISYAISYDGDCYSGNLTTIDSSSKCVTSMKLDHDDFQVHQKLTTHNVSMDAQQITLELQPLDDNSSYVVFKTPRGQLRLGTIENLPRLDTSKPVQVGGGLGGYGSFQRTVKLDAGVKIENLEKPEFPYTGIPGTYSTNKASDSLGVIRWIKQITKISSSSGSVQFNQRFKQVFHGPPKRGLWFDNEILEKSTQINF